MEFNKDINLDSIEEIQKENEIKIHRLNRVRDGWMTYNKNDIAIGRSLNKYGEWSQGELDLFKQFLSNDDNVIEVGSNIGSHTLGLSIIVENGLVFAFEPERVCFQLLCANMAINSRLNCWCYQKALSDNIEKPLYLPSYNYKDNNNYGGSRLLNEGNPMLRIEVEKLDNRFHNLNKLRLLKIDAEGMELNVLKGSLSLINRTRPILYLENEEVSKSKELISYIFDLGYKLFWHIVPLYNPNNFYNNKENIFKNFASINMIGIHIKSKTIINSVNEITDINYHPLNGKS